MSNIEKIIKLPKRAIGCEAITRFHAKNNKIQQLLIFVKIIFFWVKIKTIKERTIPVKGRITAHLGISLGNNTIPHIMFCEKLFGKSAKHFFK